MTNQRKHVTQMSRRELIAVLDHIQTLRVTGLDSPHVRDRKVKWNVTDGEIKQAVKHGELIECHANNFPDIRFVTRKDIGMRSICVCSNVTGEVITVWVNGIGDNHQTLKQSDYQWKTDLTSVFNTRKAAIV